MPNRLKSFELHGYKTFPSRTEFIFADGITAIVGPNGSGKSNIADALRWVLGEQSFGLLRAKKTEDMIFAGSEHRPRAGMASATIVFNNEDGWLPIDFSEVGITRRAYRDGDNEYLLNGQRVRLKDVSELLARSGLAERTYTVIGQGLVDAALSLKAEERRRLFEEAAGIGLHRARRDEALRRLETTQRNLERVQDILAEIQPRVRSLERQAKRTQEYEQVRTDLKILLREWYGYHWHLAQTELTEAKDVAHRQEISLEKVRQEQVNLDQKLSLIRGQSLELRQQLSESSHKLSTAYSQREQITREQAVVEERIRSLDVQLKSNEAEILRLQDEIAFYQEQRNSASAEIQRLEDEKSEAQSNVAETTRVLEELQIQVHQATNEIQGAQKTYSDLNTRQTILREQFKGLQLSILRHKNDLEDISLRLNEAESELTNSQSSLSKAIEQQKKDDRKFFEADEAIQMIRREISRLEILKRETLEKHVIEKARLTQLQTQLNVMHQAEDNLSGYADGARLLLQAYRDSRIRGAQGALSNLLEVPDEYEKAIASALGEYLGAVLVNDWDGVEESLEILERGSARGALLILEILQLQRPLTIDLQKSGVKKDAIIGIASDIVHVKSDIRPVIDLLLGQVVIVKDRSTARRLISQSNWSATPLLRFVTLNGEVFHSYGSVLTASSVHGILNRPRQHKELEAATVLSKDKLAEIMARVTKVDEDLLVAHGKEKELYKTYQLVVDKKKLSSTEVVNFGLSVEKAHRIVEWNKEQVEKIKSEIRNQEEEEARISNDLESLEKETQESLFNLREKSAHLESLTLEEAQGKASYWQTQYAVIERALKDAESKKKERFDAWDRTNKSLLTLQARSVEMDSELSSLAETRNSLTSRLSGITQDIEDIRALANPAETELAQVEKTLNQWISTDVSARQALSAAEHQYAQARINLSRKQEALDSLRRRIEDDFGLVSFEYVQAVSGPTPLPLSGMVEELPKVLQVAPDLEENVQRQRALLRRMGPVNPDAQTEYHEVKQRFEFLTNQVADLHKAESDIEEVIAELDLLMEREFRKTFDSVAQEFRQIFTRLFGGGMARLVLTDPENMTDTGIDIEARLPGRREQGLSLLSGGERSLAAAALVFALLRISPTPFCIFDEVDAMLDEANVSRFRELLLELCEHTQFIIITHNRNTVQAASVIYGVTMGRDSASQVIGLKLDELTEEYGVQHA